MNSTTPLLSARDLQVRFGGVLAVNNVSFDVSAARSSR
jgi:ABC-type branched-subunit amino acid transport system ATPase component